MAVQEDLIYFLKNGKLENTEFGITRNQLFEILGEPENIQYNKYKWNAMLYFYEPNFEFYFDDYSKDARLSFIQVKYPVEYNGKQISFKSYDWTTDLTIEEAIEILNENNINFVKKSHPSDDLFCWLETEKSVRIFFTNQNEDKNVWTLYSFGKSIEFESPILFPIKQINFQIGSEYYEQLRENAEKTKISIANQCREIIENYLEEKNKKRPTNSPVFFFYKNIRINYAVA